MDFIRNNLSTMSSRHSDLLPMALARAISACLPFPSTEQSNASSCYNEIAFTKANECISVLTDLFPFDHKRVVELTRTLWIARFMAAYPAVAIFSTMPSGSEADFLGFGSLLSPVEIEFIRTNCLALVSASNAFYSIVLEMACFATPVVAESIKL